MGMLKRGAAVLIACLLIGCGDEGSTTEESVCITNINDNSDNDVIQEQADEAGLERSVTGEGDILICSDPTSIDTVITTGDNELSRFLADGEVVE